MAELSVPEFDDPVSHSSLSIGSKLYGSRPSSSSIGESDESDSSTAGASSAEKYSREEEEDIFSPH